MNLGPNATLLRSGRDHSCALVGDGTLFCWSRGDQGQLGTGYTNNVGETTAVSPTNAADLPDRVIDVAVGYDHTCALLSDHTVRCFGANNYRQLGYPGKPHARIVEIPKSLPAVQTGGPQ